MSNKIINLPDGEILDNIYDKTSASSDLIDHQHQTQLLIDRLEAVVSELENINFKLSVMLNI